MEQRWNAKIINRVMNIKFNTKMYNLTIQNVCHNLKSCLQWGNCLCKHYFFILLLLYNTN